MNKQKKNILWMFIEDLNPIFNCYDDAGIIKTPCVDKLAEEGVLFEKCFSTAGVCSASRSAIITGKMQTTTGAHNHDSSYDEAPLYLPDNIKTMPEIFKSNGYNTFNIGKTHYNFEWKREDLFSLDSQNTVSPWRECEDRSKPFFGQIQFHGGKSHEYEAKDMGKHEGALPNDAAAKTLPECYPQHPDLVTLWTNHYNCAVTTDQQISRVIDALKEDDLLENTILIVLADHGNMLPRSKQFIYVQGTHIPCIFSYLGTDDVFKRGERRKETMTSLDISATTLSLAGIDIPDWYDGQDLFKESYIPHEYVYSAKDRMDFTIDRIRCLRNQDGFSYIRNFMPERPYMQHNYRDSRDYMKTMRRLYVEGKLTPNERQFWGSDRPDEELYDTKNDPCELDSLAKDPEHKKLLLKMRNDMDSWIDKTDDKGQYPEEEIAYEAVYKIWGADCINPEYDNAKAKLGPLRAPVGINEGYKDWEECLKCQRV